MKTFPTYERRVGLKGGPTASYGTPGAMRVSDAPGRALAGLGNALQGLGDDIAKAQARIQDSQDDVWFSKARAETAQDITAFDNQARLDATGEAGGYQESVLGRLNEVRQKHLESAPSERARQMYEEWGYGYETTVFSETAKFRAGSELAKRTSDFKAAMLAHKQTVFDDPSQYPEVRKRALDDLEGAKQWMTPAQEAKWREDIENGLQFERGRSVVKRDPEGFLKESGGAQGGDVVDRIIGIESGGKANAKNPNSTATGAGQFIESTWLSMIKEHRPDIWKANSRADILALRKDPNLSREMVAAYAKENATYLGARGVGATPGNVYLAHFLGPAGAVSVAKADKSAPVSGILPAGVIKANGSILRGKTAGDVQAWAARKMSGAKGGQKFAGNQQYSALTPDQMSRLHSAAESEIKARARDAKAAQTAQLAEIRGAFELGIATGDSGVTPQAILASPLADSDKAKLVNKWEAENKDKVTAADTATKLADPAATFDRFSKDDRKGVGLVYDAAAGGGSLFGDDPKARNLAAMIYSRSGMLPEKASNELRGALVSGDPSRLAAAGAFISYLMADNPDALGSGPHGADLVDAGQTYRHMTQRLGLKPEEAGKRMADLADPEKLRQREALLETKAVKDAIKNVTETNVRDVWDTLGPNVFTGYSLGGTEETRAVMVADYKDMLKESIVEAAGDMDLAEEKAAAKFKRLYAPSSFSQFGDNVISWLPPELTYQAAPDGSHTYIRKQLAADMEDEGIEADDLYLLATTQTQSDVRNGAPPAYAVYYRSKDGKLHQYPGEFRADVSRIESDFDDERATQQRNRDIQMMREEMEFDAGPAFNKERNAAAAKKKEKALKRSERKRVDETFDVETVEAP